MKKTIVLAFAAVALFGCISRQQVDSQEDLDTRVTVGPDLSHDVFVRDVRCTKGSGLFYAFQANLVNRNASDLPVEWKVQWLDQDGIEIDSVVSTWNALMLSGYEIRGLKGVAPRQDAADMRFYVRRARGN